MTKVLICHSDAGNGPLSAATALAEGIYVVSKGQAEVSIVDVLEETNKLGFMVTGLYNYLLSKNLAWNSLGLRIFYNSSLVKSGALLSESVGSMKRLLERERADVILFTNPWIIGYVLRAVRQLNAHKRPKLVSVVVDIGDELPPGWYFDDIDRFIVATEDAKHNLIRFGADASRIEILGIPVRTEFLGQPGDGRGATACLECGATTKILVMGGRSGTRNTYPIVRGLMSIAESFHVTVQCGQNRKLMEKVEGLSAGIGPNSSGKAGKHLEVLGFVPDVSKYMREANLLITKPGALTVSEATTVGLPLILDVYPMVMGQEIGNVNYVSSRGLGLVAPTPDDVPRLVTDFMSDESLQLRLLSNCKAAGKLGNTFQIAREILEYVQASA